MFGKVAFLISFCNHKTVFPAMYSLATSNRRYSYSVVHCANYSNMLFCWYPIVYIASSLYTLHQSERLFPVQLQVFFFKEIILYTSGCFLFGLSNMPATPFANCFFHSDIRLGCTSYLFANSCSVFSSSIAAFALNALSCLLLIGVL